MSNRDFISVNLQCPKELWQAIQSKADSLGQDPITVAIETLNEAFGFSLKSDNAAANAEISLIKRRLNVIEQAIKPLLIDPRLGQKLVELAAERHNLDLEEVKVSLDVPIAVPRMDMYSHASYSLTDDDVEDEPDEILYDFL